MQKKRHMPVSFMTSALCHCVLVIGMLLLALGAIPVCVHAKGVSFPGSGTEEDPYLIEDAVALVKFRDLVNAGNSFDYTYFRQTSDIDLSSEGNWTPIGVYGSENYFYGYYDGAGHTISNLTIYPEDDEDGNVGFFGILGGEVRNLGIESGSIRGVCVGAIASHGLSYAAIINCYNKATVNGVRAGGIADNFQGRILFCINLGKVTSTDNAAAGILSYSCKEVRYCYSTGDNQLVTENFSGEIKKSSRISISDINRSFLKNMYQKIQDYEEDDAYSGTLCRLVLNGTNLEYARNSDIKQTSNLPSSLGGMVFVVMLGMVIVLDYFANCRKDRKGGK